MTVYNFISNNKKFANIKAKYKGGTKGNDVFTSFPHTSPQTVP